MVPSSPPFLWGDTTKEILAPLVWQLFKGVYPLNQSKSSSIWLLWSSKVPSFVLFFFFTRLPLKSEISTMSLTIQHVRLAHEWVQEEKITTSKLAPIERNHALESITWSLFLMTWYIIADVTSQENIVWMTRYLHASNKVTWSVRKIILLLSWTLWEFRQYRNMWVLDDEVHSWA